jgi:hypothetical protein
MAHKKLTLPTKICAACARPFAWRKKWARDWDQVRYCSDRCRAAPRANRSASSETEPVPPPNSSAP